MSKIRNSDDPAYSCDEAGQWWWREKRGGRVRARVLTCQHCHCKFLTYAAKKRTPKYCSDSCSSIVCRKGAFLYKDQAGAKNHAWKGGKMMQNGYVSIIVSGHHSVTKSKPRVLEHRYVMEQMLGRPLLDTETVHHKNGIKHDNRPENLELWRVHQPKGQRHNEQQHCPSCTCFKHERAGKS